MPGQERARSGQSGDHFEVLQTDLFCLGGQPSALVLSGHRWHVTAQRQPKFLYALAPVEWHECPLS